jgi:hypothetical protein
VPVQQQAARQRVALPRGSQRSNPATVPRVSQVVKPAHTPRHAAPRAQGGPAARPGAFRLGGQGRGAVGSVYGDAQPPSRTLKSVSPATPALAAEFLVCELIIIVNTLSRPKSYNEKMSEVLWRSTALTAVFFTLALTSMSQRMSKITVAFGGLIVAAVLYNATSTVKTTLDALAGKGTGVTAATSATLEASTEPPHTIQAAPSTA